MLYQSIFLLIYILVILKSTTIALYRPSLRHFSIPVSIMQKSKANSKRVFASVSDAEREGTYIMSSCGTIRSIKPYVHEFHAFAKGRWLGREIMDVLTREFGSHSPQYWSDAIRNGFVRVNGKKITEQYKFKNSDDFAHLTHRHEPPVMGSVSLIGETDSLVAVCKPPSMPMHPCGAYRYNSLMFVLEREPVLPAPQPPLFLVHRLDRVTSGVVVLAKSKSAAAKISQEIATHQPEKTYLARVKGMFPGDRLERIRLIDGREIVNMAASLSAGDDNEEDGGGNDEDGMNHKKRKLETKAASSTVVTTTAYTERRPVMSFEDLCQHDTVGYGYDPVSYPDCLLLRVPISVVSHREGVHSCDPGGKVSVSAFRGLGYCAETDTSLVECRPLTGRTHQLRLHLQFLGVPIANDPCYGGELFYGEPLKRAAAKDALRRMARLGLVPLSKVPHFDTADDASAAIDGASGGNDASAVTDPSEEAGKGDSGATIQLEGETTEHFLSRTCKYCRALTPGHVHSSTNSLSSDDSSHNLERLLHCDGIWLHSQRYRLPIDGGWCFVAPVPAFALRPGFKEWS